jgi:hypothetical protein
MRFVFVLLLAGCIGLLPGCSKDYLDRNPLSGPTNENYFTTADELMPAINSAYGAINYAPQDNIPLTLLLDCASDIGWDRNSGDLQKLGLGSHDATNGIALSVWTASYQEITKCNFILDNIYKLKGKITDAVYNRSIAEARFLRAYTYQLLLFLFGDVPLVTHVLSLDQAQLPRNNREEVLDFVLNELDSAAQNLPLTLAATETGRATKGAALAIKARAALYNGRWETAAAAAKAVMDLKIYQLHNSFPELFMYAGSSSKEIILALQFLKTSNVKIHSAPYAFLSRNAQGASNKIPSQSLVDAYECTDGFTIDRSRLYNPQKPFDNRDPRLGYTVALPGSVFYNYQFETNKDSLTCWNYNTSIPTRIDNQDAINTYASFTGYCWRKYVDLQDQADPKSSGLNITLIRYAEVLLTYAEAKIEANQVDQSVYDAINAVRQRSTVNMPPLPAGLSQAALRSAVRRERLYELACEGFRFFDIRRWKIADRVMNGPLYGRVPRGLLQTAPVIDENGVPDYSAVPNRSAMRVVETRRFNANRDYLWPIPAIEINTDTKLVQNPNY